MPYYYYMVRTPDNQLRGSVHIEPALPSAVLTAFNVPKEEWEKTRVVEVEETDYRLWREWADTGGRPPTNEEIVRCCPQHVIDPVRT